MKLRNFDNLVKAYIGANHVPGCIRDLNGTVRDAYNSSDNIARLRYTVPGNLGMAASSTSVTAALMLGTGDEAPTYDDYQLSGTRITTFSESHTSAQSLEGEMSTEITYTITNTGSASFTVREIGYFARIQYSSSGYSNTLLERTVLDAPLTLEPGAVGQLVFKTHFALPEGHPV